MEKDVRSAVHPGQILNEKMLEAGLNAAGLADALHVPVIRVVQILDGERDISPDTALRLARFFGSDAEEWLRFQNKYGLACARSPEIARDIVPLAIMTAKSKWSEPQGEPLPPRSEKPMRRI